MIFDKIFYDTADVIIEINCNPGITVAEISINTGIPSGTIAGLLKRTGKRNITFAKHGRGAGFYLKSDNVSLLDVYESVVIGNDKKDRQTGETDSLVKIYYRHDADEAIKNFKEILSQTYIVGGYASQKRYTDTL